MVKDDTSWHLTWNEMLEIDTKTLDSNESQEGLNYDDYLQVLLMFTESDSIYHRMTHLMEKNIRLQPQYEGFWIKNCIYAILVNYECEFETFGSYEIQAALSY